MKAKELHVLAHRLHDEMVSRGPWTTERVEPLVTGFYKFNPPGVRLNERSYAFMRHSDPGLPSWEEFLGLLEGSEMLRFVDT